MVSIKYVYFLIQTAALIGKLVDGQVCWRVTPIDKSQSFAIIAELQIRRTWMPLTEPRAKTPGERLNTFIKKYSHQKMKLMSSMEKHFISLLSTLLRTDFKRQHPEHSQY
jgi:hypothetical protein